MQALVSITVPDVRNLRGQCEIYCNARLESLGIIPQNEREDYAHWLVTQWKRTLPDRPAELQFLSVIITD